MTPRAVAHVIIFCAMPLAAEAQMLPGYEPDGFPTRINVSETGWSQITNIEEVKAFALDVLVTVILTASIVFHPVRLKARRTLADLLMPRLFFLYSLIGMAVGFLVIQHGYIIGFVIFGIGALLRFRSNLDDPIDTAEMILVTVLGLTIGLDLPVMGVLLAFVGWVFIWFGGRTIGVEISLKSLGEADVLETLDRIESVASGKGWKTIHRHHVPGKTNLSALFQVSAKVPQHEVEAIITQMVPEGIECKIKL